MSEIKTSINLTDRMSSTLSNLEKRLRQTEKSMHDVDTASKRMGAGGAFRSTEGIIGRINNGLNNMNNKLNEGKDKSDRLGSSLQFMKSGGFNLMNLASGIYLLQKAVSLVSNIMEPADQAQSTMARLGLFNQGPYTNKQLYRGVYDIAQQTRSDLVETGNLATRILISGAMKGPGAATSALDITKTINKAMVAGGGTKEENRRAMLQLSQSLASGLLQGDELRAIREQTPYLMKILAEGLGKEDPKFKGIDVGQLKQLGKEGELTSARIIKAFQLMENDVNKAFEKMPVTWGQSMTMISNSIKYFVYLLSTGDNALARIRERFAEIAKFLYSGESGIKFMEQLAGLINFVVDGIMALGDMIGDFIGGITGGVEGLGTAIAVMGGIALVWLTACAIAWAVMNWEVLLVAFVIMALIGVLNSLGITSQQVVVFIGKLFGGLAVIVYDVAAFIYNIFGGFMYKLYFICRHPILSIKYLFLEVLQTVINAVYKVFSVLSPLLAAVGADLPKKANILIEEQQKDTKSKIFTGKGFNKLDYKSISEGVSKGSKIASNAYKAWQNAKVNLKGAGSLKTTYAGSNLSSGTKVNGGNLDSVGKINSAVNIADDDIKLLKDIAAKQFLLKLATSTPKVKITFGDVRESADVSKIIDTMSDMLADAAATSLVE